jgi:hypothetical protein
VHLPIKKTKKEAGIKTKKEVGIKTKKEAGIKTKKEAGIKEMRKSGDRTDYSALHFPDSIFQELLSDSHPLIKKINERVEFTYEFSI